MSRYRPNFCFSECAGRVLVAVGTPRRRIAERFRWVRQVYATVKPLFVVIVALLTEAAIGQTFFELRNFYVKAPVLDANGVPLSGTNYLAELWGSVTPVTLAPARGGYSYAQREFAPFLGTNGYFLGNTVGIVDATAGGLAWLQVRVWDSRLGTNYEEVAVRGLGGYGASPLFYARGTGGPLCDPPCVGAHLVGLQSFRLAAMSAILMKRIRRQGNEVVIEWFGGFPHYQIQTTTNLSVGWQDVGAPTTLTSITNSPYGVAGFFRVIGLPY